LLVKAVDRMAQRIAEGRANLLREKEIVDQVVQNITSAVVSVDADGLVLMHNQIAADFLGVEDGDSIMAALQSNPTLERVAAFVGAVAGETTESTTVRLETPEKVEKEWSLIWIPLPRAVDPGALLVVEDVTEVLRSQRLEAWEEMARMIAHEVKNPLTPIQLSTEHMQEVWRRQPEEFDSALASCTRNILRQVDTLREIAGEFSIYSHEPRFDPRSEDLVARLRESVEAYESAAIRGIHVAFESDHAELFLRFDAHLLGRAVQNLLENAVRVTQASGEVVVALGTDGDEVCISVADTGPGTPPDTLQRIFDPHFSTHTRTGGSGLGLPIARQVVEQHGGTISARNRRRGGLEVIIRLPLDRSPS
jgi:two-component system nitrogen regulation sensor histidine kinase NtrY